MMNKRFLMSAILLSLTLSFTSAAELPLEQASGEKSSLYEVTFANVGGIIISEAELREYVYQQNRSRFYHGKPPEGEELTFYREMGDQLIERYLLARAAKEAGLISDNSIIDKKVQAYDAKYAGNSEWQQARLLFLPMYKQLLEIEQQTKQYEKHVKAKVVLSPQQVKEFYSRHIDKFTEPPQNHVAVILLGVSPSAGAFVWQAVQEQADNIYTQLENGAAFDELAELHSTDLSAAQGGDMGFIHEGMTAKKVEDLLDKLKVGEFTKPIVLLDGISIFKLMDRKGSIVHTFDEVQQRATALALTDAKNSAWLTTKEKLKQDINIEINSHVFNE